MLRFLFLALSYYMITGFTALTDNLPTLKSASITDIIRSNQLEGSKTKDVVISTNDTTQKNSLKTLALSGSGKNTEIKIQNNITQNEDGSKTTTQKVLVNGKETSSNTFESSAPKIDRKLPIPSVPAISNTNIDKKTSFKTETIDKKANNSGKATLKQELKGNDIYYTIDKKIDLSQGTKIKTEQLKLTEGDKNIYINFTPEITFAGGCNTNCGNQNKCNMNKKNVVNNKKITKRNVKKRTKITKTTKKTASKNITSKTTKIQSMDTFLKNDDSDVRTILASSKQKDNGSLMSLDCIGGCQTDMYNSKITNNIQTQQKTINRVVEKEAPIYVINRIIQVDDDKNLSEEQINDMVRRGDAIVTIQQIGGKNIAQSRIGSFRTADSLKSAYIANSIVNYREDDVVNNTNEAYGEIAFVDVDD